MIAFIVNKRQSENESQNDVIVVSEDTTLKVIDMSANTTKEKVCMQYFVKVECDRTKRRWAPYSALLKRNFDVANGDACRVKERYASKNVTIDAGDKMRSQRHCHRNVERNLESESQNDVTIVSVNINVDLTGKNANTMEKTGLHRVLCNS